MEHDWTNERVVRVKCTGCGSTGPMAKSADAADFLAVLCEWDEKNSLCPTCKMLREKARPAQKTTVPNKRRKP